MKNTMKKIENKKIAKWMAYFILMMYFQINKIVLTSFANAIDGVHKAIGRNWNAPKHIHQQYKIDRTTKNTVTKWHGWICRNRSIHPRIGWRRPRWKYKSISTLCSTASTSWFGAVEKKCGCKKLTWCNSGCH